LRRCGILNVDQPCPGDRPERNGELQPEQPTAAMESHGITPFGCGSHDDRFCAVQQSSLIAAEPRLVTARFSR
jgi:hypothetical protein